MAGKRGDRKTRRDGPRTTKSTRERAAATTREGRARRAEEGKRRASPAKKFRDNAQPQQPGRTFAPAILKRLPGVVAALAPTSTAREVDTNPAYKDPVLDRKKPLHRDNSPSTSYDYGAVSSTNKTPSRTSAPTNPSKIKSTPARKPVKTKAEKPASSAKTKSSGSAEMDLNKLTKAGYSHSDLVKMRNSKGGKKKIEAAYKKTTGKSAKYK